MRRVFFLLLLSVTASLYAEPAVNPSKRIDQLVIDGLNKQGLTPNEPASDEVFVRRLYLDVVGRIPTKAEAVTFIESKDPTKRLKLIKELLQSDGYVSHQYNWHSDLLRARTSIAGNGGSTESGMAYEMWLKESIRENKPYQQLVYEMVTASGSTWENPAIGYYMRDYGMPLDNLAITSQVFLGTQIVCAQCHDHPFDEWTQMDYYHLAAFTYPLVTTNSHPVQKEATSLFRRKNGKMGDEEKRELQKAFSEILFPVRFNNVVVSDRHLRLPHDYKYDDAKPKSLVEPATLMGPEAVISESTGTVQAFGEWLTSPDNPRFTKVIANRMWKKLLGVGLIEPVDDIKSHTVASNPELMTYLEELMLSLDYDLRAFQEVILNTETYQREASLQEVEPGVPYYFAGPVLRRMSAEQIWDSLVAMCVENPDAPDKGRELLAERRVATVKLIAEAIYDQEPAEFLRNGLEVVKVQKLLSAEIDAAQEKVTKAREAGDPDLIREAQKETRDIRNKLYEAIGELVYREELAKKYALVTAGKTGSESDSILDETAAALLEDGSSHSVEETMEMVGMSGEKGGKKKGYGRTGGLIDELISAMFAEEQSALRMEARQQEAAEQEAWNVKKGDKNAYKSFTDSIRPRMKRASEMNQPASPGHFLREFGQSDKELVNNSTDEASITQALALLNGPTLGAVVSKYSVLSRAMKGETFQDRLDTIYLTMLSRYPTREEREIFREAWTADPESGSVQGIVWTMLNTRQFLFIQ